MLERQSIENYNLTEHAIKQMARRAIKKADVALVLLEPEEIVPLRAGRVVYQSRLKRGDPEKIYLLRVFVDIDKDPPEVVTAYRTGKVGKYAISVGGQVNENYL